MLLEDEPALGDDEQIDWGDHPPLVVDWFSSDEEDGGEW